MIQSQQKLNSQLRTMIGVYLNQTKRFSRIGLAKFLLKVKEFKKSKLIIKSIIGMFTVNRKNVRNYFDTFIKSLKFKDMKNYRDDSIKPPKPPKPPGHAR